VPAWPGFAARQESGAHSKGGALPNLLPGGRPVTESRARAEVAAAWDVVALPAKVGRDTSAIIAAGCSGELAWSARGGLDPGDLVRTGDMIERVKARTFVGLPGGHGEENTVTDFADVILPVAPTRRKAGAFVNWEGRVRTFQAALKPTP